MPTKTVVIFCNPPDGYTGPLILEGNLRNSEVDALLTILPTCPEPAGRRVLADAIRLYALYHDEQPTPSPLPGGIEPT